MSVNLVSIKNLCKFQFLLRPRNNHLATKHPSKIQRHPTKINEILNRNKPFTLLPYACELIKKTLVCLCTFVLFDCICTSSFFLLSSRAPLSYERTMTSYCHCVDRQQDSRIKFMIERFEVQYVQLLIKSYA